MIRKLISLFLVVLSVPSFAEGLNGCEDQFIGGTVAGAPALLGNPPGIPFGSNQHLCYRTGQHSFFAMEYWPERFAPRWVAYKIDPAHFGDDACNVYTRDQAACYFSKQTWAEFEQCEDAADPFHADERVASPKLSDSDFAHTGHDRGHIAPRQAFSWDVCGTYQTFTMANMSPQRAYLNREIWQYLERQVLTWAIDAGPLYVVSGTTFRRFPDELFAVYQDGVLNAAQIYKAGTTMADVVEQNHLNYQQYQKGQMLRPKSDTKPDHVSQLAGEMVMPTGYFKVIFRPGDGQQQARAIGFLLPHTYEISI